MRYKLIGFVLIAALLTGCGAARQDTAPRDKVSVVASFYPMYEMARAVGGDHVQVQNLVPPGAEPHDWEPGSKEIQAINSAKVFVYNGAGLEHWVDKTLRSLDNKQLVVVEASRGIDLMQGVDTEETEKNALDPHVWLDPLGAAREVEAIRDALIKVDPANRSAYEQNAEAYKEKLNALDQEYRTGLAACPQKTFFTSHAAFGYLAKRYGLTQYPIMGLAPDAEPTPKALADVVATAKKENIKYIFFETLVSDKLAKVVAQEVGAQTLVLNPLEGLTQEEMKAGKDYLAVMRENLANLKTALGCAK